MTRKLIQMAFALGIACALHSFGFAPQAYAQQAAACMKLEVLTATDPDPVNGNVVTVTTYWLCPAGSPAWTSLNPAMYFTVQTVYITFYWPDGTVDGTFKNLYINGNHEDYAALGVGVFSPQTVYVVPGGDVVRW